MAATLERRREGIVSPVFSPDVVSGDIRDQLGLRVALGWLSGNGYGMTMGRAEVQPPADSTGSEWVTGLLDAGPLPLPLRIKAARRSDGQPATSRKKSSTTEPSTSERPTS